MDVSLKKIQGSSDAPVTAPTEGESQLAGQELLDSIVTMTGLPNDAVRQEILDILLAADLAGGDVDASNPEMPELSNLSLDQLREAMLVYLETIHSDLKDEHSSLTQEESEESRADLGENQGPPFWS